MAFPAVASAASSSAAFGGRDVPGLNSSRTVYRARGDRCFPTDRPAAFRCGAAVDGAGGGGGPRPVRGGRPACAVRA
eukprot:scaffold45324_cov66-Phaeocystis_antarctica.AAC.1